MQPPSSQRSMLVVAISVTHTHGYCVSQPAPCGTFQAKPMTSPRRQPALMRLSEKAHQSLVSGSAEPSTGQLGTGPSGYSRGAPDSVRLETLRKTGLALSSSQVQTPRVAWAK